MTYRTYLLGLIGLAAILLGYPIVCLATGHVAAAAWFGLGVSTGTVISWCEYLWRKS